MSHTEPTLMLWVHYDPKPPVADLKHESAMSFGLVVCVWLKPTWSSPSKVSDVISCIQQWRSCISPLRTNPLKRSYVELVWSPRNAKQSRHAHLPSRAGLEYARAIQESLNEGKQRTEHEEAAEEREKKRMRRTSLDPEWEEGGVSEGAELEWLQNCAF